MNCKPNKLLLTLLMLLLPFGLLAAQWPQGLGMELRDVVETQGLLIALDEESRILRSEDGGQSFEIISERPLNDIQLFALSAKGTVVIAVGEGAQILRTETITAEAPVFSQTTGVPNYFGDLKAISGNPDGQWVIVGENGILVSDDSGVTWSRELAFESFLSVAWSGTHWVATGGFGTGVWRSGDGENWTQDALIDFKTLAADGQGNLLALDTSGVVYRSENHGESFAEITQVSWVGLESIAASGENRWVLGGQEGSLLMLESDLSHTVLLESLDTENVGYALEVGDDGTVWVAGLTHVEPPLIDAPAGSTEPIEVTLVPATAGDEVFYSIDGSDPRESLPGQVFSYTEPFTVGGTVLVRSVARNNGIYSAIVEREIQAGEFLEPFQLTIQVDAGEVVLTQDVATSGYTFGLEYTTDLLAEPVVWTDENHAAQAGAGTELIWTVTPVPSSPRFWRVGVIED